MRYKKTAFLQLFILLSFSLSLYAQSANISGSTEVNKCETNQYTITINNNSGNPLTSIVVTNSMPVPGFSYVSGSCALTAPGCSSTADPTISGNDLIWDTDTLCGGAYTLNNGDTLTITFSMETDCTAVSGSDNVHVDYEIGGTPFFDDTSISIRVLPGAITIKKTPNVIPAAVGDTVTWTLRVENTGLGKVVNVEITDVLGAGLTYVSSTPAGNNVGQTTTWDSSSIPGLADMDPGEFEEITLEVTVSACENLDNTADAKWGCSPADTCWDTSVDGGAATAAIQLEVKNPDLDMNPPDFSFASYCDDITTISFPITNQGDGNARNIKLYVDWTPFTVANVTAPATYNTVDGCFENIPDLAPGSSFTLEFDLSYTNWCTRPLPESTHLWTPIYEDDCGNEFYPPVGLESSFSPPQVPTLSITKTGGPAEIQIGSSITYHITVDYSGITSCGISSTGNITIVDTIPNGFTVTTPVPDGGVWVDSGDGTGGTVTWTYDPSVDPHFETDLEINLPGTADCETYCFTTFTNTVDASVTDCCGCDLTASASQGTAIECEQLVDSDKSAVPSTVIRCDTVQYTNTYIFEDNPVLDTVDLSQLVFTEQADNEQEYDPGSLAVTLSGSGDITACALSGLTDTTPGAGGNLIINFSNCNTYGSVRNKTLTIIYRLRITEATISACSGSTFYSWSALDLNITTGACLQDGEIHETTQVTIDPPAMSISIAGMSTLMNKCQTETITLTMTQISSVADPKDARAVLSGLNYYIVDPAATVCGGSVAPTSCTPALVGNDYVWYFADGFTGSGQTATLQFEVQKRCTGLGDLTATVYYDDNCNDNGNYDDTCSTSSTYSPLILLSGDLLIEKTPEVYYATTSTVAFKIYVTNRGTGTAYSVWVDDVLGAGLDYNSAVVNNMTGVTVTADQDHTGGAINGATVSISEMAPAERREITLTADIIDCNNLTNDVSTSWGCNAVDCQVPVSDSSTVLILSPNLVNTNVTGTPINACATETATITIRNAGQVTLYNLQVTETLPAGLTYIPGTTQWRVNAGGWNGPDGAYDPVISGFPQMLQWTSTQISTLASIDAGDIIEIQFQVYADCTFSGGQITVSTSYETPCGESQTSADSVYSVVLREPDLSINKIRTAPPEGQPLDCSQNVSWTITVTNNGTYIIPVVWVEDTLGAAFTYVSSTGDPVYGPADNGFNAGQNVYWEIKNLPAGQTATLTLNAITDAPPVCVDDLDNTYTVHGGCGDSDGLSSTDPSTEMDVCLFGTGITGTHSSTREPGAAIMNIIVAPALVNACDDDAQFTITVQNNGPTDASNVDLVITLPSGLAYNAGSTTVTCPIGGSNADPTISGNQLIFYDVGSTASNMCDSIPGGGVATVQFSVHADCYVTATMSLDLYYYDCCGNIQYRTSATHTLTSTYPQLSVSITPDDVDLDCYDSGDTVTWTIQVDNTGAGDADWVRIEYALGTNIAYDSSNPPATNMGGGVYGWEIGPLASGNTITVQLTAHLTQPSNDCDINRRTSTVDVYWGCKVGAVDGNPTTADYDCESSVVVSDFTVVRIPDLHLNTNNHVAAQFFCTVDGTNSARISLRVRNNGDAPINDDFRIQVSDNHGWTTAGYFSADFGGTLPINPATQNTIFINWPLDCMTCTSNITVVLDLDDDICECRENNNSGTLSNIDTQTYNLKVNSITAVCEDDGLSTVSVEIENDGCQDIAGSFALYLEDDQGNSATISVSGLAAGSTTTVDFTSWPNDCTASVTFAAKVDSGDAICECDGTDNTLSGIVYNNTSPDLAVTSVTPSTTCVADGTITGQIQVTVRNRGNGPVNSDFRISINDGQGWNSELWYQADLGGTLPLAAGASETVTFSWTRSFTATPYVCTFPNITATVDSQNGICECTTTNNATTNTYTQPYPNLRVLSITPSCLADGQYSIDVVVDNNGCTDANGVVVQLSDNDGQTQSQTINVAAGAQLTLTFAPWPADGNPASLTFTATIDPSSAICELSGTDNSATQIYTRPNLTIISITPACLADANYQVSIVIENNGSEAINSDFMIQLSDNDGNTFEQSFTALGGSLPFNNGTQQTVVFNNWPVDCDPTIINFTAIVDSQDDVCESNATDNTNTASFTIYDLEATSVTASTVCSSDGSITGTITVTVTNTGGDSVVNDFQISVDDGQGWNAELWYNADLSGALPLAVGTSETVTFNWTRDFTTEPYICDYTITAVVDSKSDICECTFTNNTNNATYHVPLPDFTIDSMSAGCDSDGRLNLELVLSNIGCEAMSANFDIRISDNAGHIRTETFTALGGSMPFGAGTSQTLTVEDWEFTCANPTIDFNVVLDPRDQVCELNGDNNTFDWTYNLVEGDIRIDDIKWECNPDGSIDFEIRISNRGYGDAAGAVLNVYDSNSARIYTQTFNLSVNSSTTFRFTTEPYPGDRDNTFRFVVDQGEDLCECNRGNNEREVLTNCCSSGLVTAKEVDKTSINACEEVEFTLTISNVGGLNAYNLIITDKLADGLSYVPGSTKAAWASGSFAGDPIISGKTLQWTIEGPLNGGDPTGEELILSYKAQAGACTAGRRTFTNTFTVTAEDGSGTAIPTEGCDGDDSDPIDSASAEVTLICPSLEFKRECPAVKQITLKDTFEYTIIISNNGDGGSELINIEVKDEIPDGWTLESFTSEGAQPISSPSAGSAGTLIWSYGNLKLHPGETIRITIRIKPNERACGTTFSDSLIVSATDNCGTAAYSGEAQQCPVLVVCGMPLLELGKECPRAEEPGGIYRFELTLRNRGDGEAENVVIEDTLPDNFQFVPGSTVFDGQAFADPQINGQQFVWNLGTISKETEHILTFSAIAPADTDPGRYCNQAQAKGYASDGSQVSSEIAECCTILRREAAECCLQVEEQIVGSTQMPEGPLSFIEPYFRTEEAMFTSYAALHFWQKVKFEDESLASFIKERLKNYALSTVEELYLRSRLGIVMGDDSLWLAYGGAYPQRTEQGWVDRSINKSMTPAQLGFELIALKQAIEVEDNPEIKDRLKEIINKKLLFLEQWIDDLPHEWRLEKGRVVFIESEEKGGGAPQWKLEQGSIERGKEQATFYDCTALLLSMVELRKAGYAIAEVIDNKIRAKLRELDNDEFNKDRIKEELLYILAVAEFGNVEQPRKKIEKFEEFYNKGEIELDSLYLYALASYVDYRVGGNLSSTIFADMKKRFYLANTGIFADIDTEFTHKISLESIAPLLLAFEPEAVNQKDFFAVSLCRMIEETGLFLKQGNIIVQRTPLTMLKNYPFVEEMLPILSFNRGKGNMAPVFTEEVIIRSAYMRPLGENVIPLFFSKVFSPNYEYKTSEITMLSYALQYLGNKLMGDDERIIKEEGRSLNEHGRKYIEALMESGAGIDLGGNIVLPYEAIALKGVKEGEFDFEPLTTRGEFSTATLANLLLAEKLYVESRGEKWQQVAKLMGVQSSIVKEFEKAGYIPAAFRLFMDSDGRIVRLIPFEEKAAKSTIAKLFLVLEDQFLKETLESDRGMIQPEDMILFSLAPELSRYFEDEIRDFIESRPSLLSYVAADVLARRIAGLGEGASLDELLKFWDVEIALPRAERIESIARGSVYYYEPQNIILYLLAIQGSETNKFRRTLDFFTCLLEGEWGVLWEKATRTLPAAEYWLLKELPKENIEPGDLLTLRARVENRCPMAYMRALDLPSLFLKADFVPPLIYAGTEYLEELNFLRDFLWSYENFTEGSVLEYIYQALIPRETMDNYIEGTYRARGYTGYQPYGPESASGDYCEDIHRIDRLPITPLQEIEGLIFSDINVNGRKDAGEGGLPGIMVKDTRGRIYRSDAEGRFVILAGEENVAVQIELKSVSSHFVLTTVPTRVVNRQFAGIISFGLVPCMTVKGFVYRDDNANERYDEGEERIKGLVLQAESKETISGSRGMFIFRNLPVSWKEQITIKSEQPYYDADISTIRIHIEEAEGENR